MNNVLNNNSRMDIINNKQSQLKRVSYTLKNMRACLDKGTMRKNQEDSVLLLSHPYNDEFQLLAVSDGMGGLSCGDIASNIALSEILKWFESLPSNYYFTELSMYKEIYQKIDDIDETIRKTCYGGGTTLSIAIVSKTNTILLNAGDSRIYITKAGELKQISVDHSLSWELFKQGEIASKEDVRFHKDNHLICSRLGCERKKLTIDENILQNNDYDNIFLFTDGITDCISDNQLVPIIDNSNFNNVVENIVDETLNNVSQRFDLNKAQYYNVVHGGKDNLAVATYLKKIRR